MEGAWEYFAHNCLFKNINVQVLLWYKLYISLYIYIGERRYHNYKRNIYNNKQRMKTLPNFLYTCTISVALDTSLNEGEFTIK